MGRVAQPAEQVTGPDLGARLRPERFRAVVAVHLFLLRGTRVLLLRRQNTGYADGNYSVIAGHLDGAETATEAMIREAVEEVGIIVARKDLGFVHVMHRREANNQDERIDLFYVATRWRGEPEIREPDKCGELRWSALDDLPVNVVPYVALALGHYRGHRAYSEFWPTGDASVKPGDPAHEVHGAR